MFLHIFSLFFLHKKESAPPRGSQVAACGVTRGSVGVLGGGLGRRGGVGDRGGGHRGGGLLDVGGVGLRGPGRRPLLVALLVAAHHGVEEEVERVGVVALDPERDALHRPSVVGALLDLLLGHEGAALPARRGVRAGGDLADLLAAQDDLVDHRDRLDEGPERRVERRLLRVEQHVERALVVLVQVGPAFDRAVAVDEPDSVLDDGLAGAADLVARDEQARDAGTDEGADGEGRSVASHDGELLRQGGCQTVHSRGTFSQRDQVL